MKKITKTLATIMLAVAAVFAAGCGNGNGSNNSADSGGHDYVDLGLPSGTLWATCNVGANAPEEFGYYFAWGETTIKYLFDWRTYKYFSGDYSQLTKYNFKPDYGYQSFTDGQMTLQPDDDAAAANWGNGWRIPTKEQWEELKQNTTSQWTTQNDVNGWLFTASNGQSLFLPAAGSRWYENLNGVGYCYYWSSTLNADDPVTAWIFDDMDSYYLDTSNDRTSGLSVRPVRSRRAD